VVDVVLVTLSLLWGLVWDADVFFIVAVMVVIKDEIQYNCGIAVFACFETSPFSILIMLAKF